LRKQEVKKGRIRRNLSRLEINRTYKKAGPATLFDVLYRLRIRANYGNVDAFVEGCGSLNDAKEFAQAIYVVVDATAATLEALLQAYAGSALLASVITELSRRHSTEEVVAARASIHLPTSVLSKTAFAPARPSEQ